MAHAGQFGRSGLGRADIHPAIDLARIGVDDFRAEAFGDVQGKRGLANPGGPDDEADLDRGGRGAVILRRGGGRRRYLKRIRTLTLPSPTTKCGRGWNRNSPTTNFECRRGY